ncbi:ribbon-helix-helix domain-containing protein [Azospirillum sp. A39]|uniref:ribbon-helix-helix domain-containing protein n=1 Tax=Azospirillum sp. A39 TaxID=3462279 RepID=UPI004045A46B
MSPLVCRTMLIAGRPTQVRLEPSYWEALEEIGRREGRDIDDLCSELKERLEEQTRRRGVVSVANAVRVFVVGYFRQAATDKGHVSAGHGRGDPFISTPFDNARAVEGTAGTR